MFIHRFLLVTCILSTSAFSIAPVVSDSENYALIDEQEAAVEQPLAHDQATTDKNSLETPIARETFSTDNNNSENVSILNKLQGLQQEVQELRGQLDVQTHELSRLQEQQLSFYKDLDARLQGPFKAASNTAVVMPPIVPSSKKKDIAVADAPNTVDAANVSRGNPADEQISYLAAYELINKKEFDSALPAMESFVTQYPQGGYTANAQYWLGELYMVKKNYPAAIAHFDIVLKQFPSSSKSSASQLKMGYALAASGQKNEAIQRLKMVMKNYPDTHTAQLASAKLETLRY